MYIESTYLTQNFPKNVPRLKSKHHMLIFKTEYEISIRFLYVFARPFYNYIMECHFLIFYPKLKLPVIDPLI